jgi:secondary thiamine-phosphate synthase enzyme
MGYLGEISIHSNQRAELIKLDSQVQQAVAVSGVTHGVCHIYVPHTTAGVTINEGADPAVAEDLLAKLEELVPRSPRYRHAEGNADSHIKASLVGASATVFVRDGRPLLGTWQSIFLCEFDGPRHRQVLIKVTQG